MGLGQATPPRQVVITPPPPLDFKMADLSLDESRKEEQLAEGILAILSPAVQQVDGKIGDVR
jgi:hypothetical protein